MGQRGCAARRAGSRLAGGIVMPWWIGLVIQVALKFGLPAVSKHLSPGVLELIQKILGAVGGAPNPIVAANTLSMLHEVCDGVICDPAKKA